MGKQHNKIIKRRRRKVYLKRKAELEKQNAVRQKKIAKPAAEKAPAQPVKKAPAKKTPAKKVSEETPKAESAE